MKKDLNKVWISLDLEMNHDKDGNTDDIIQIGAVAFDVRSGKVKDSLNVLVKLPLEENGEKKVLSPFVATLTGITEDQIERHGKGLMLSYHELVDFVERNSGYHEAVCWGGNDAQYLYNELCKKRSFSEDKNGRFIFTPNYFDCKKLFQTYCLANGMDLKSGMAKSMSRVGLNFKGRIHNAHDDALNCAEMFSFLMNKFKHQ